MEWLPIEGATLTKILAGGITTGGLGWLLRHSPRKVQRWVENRINAERRAMHWEMTAKELEREMEAILHRVSQSRERQEKLDSLLGSSDSSISIQPPTRPPLPTSEQSTRNSTD